MRERCKTKPFKTDPVSVCAISPKISQ